MLYSMKNQNKFNKVLIKIVRDIRKESAKRGFPMFPKHIPYQGIASDIVGYVMCGRLGMIVIDKGFADKPQYHHQTFVVPAKSDCGISALTVFASGAMFIPSKWITQEGKDTIPDAKAVQFDNFVDTICSNDTTYFSGNIFDVLEDILAGGYEAEVFMRKLQQYGLVTTDDLSFEIRKAAVGVLPRAKFKGIRNGL